MRLRSGADSRMSLYNIFVSLGVSTLFVLSAKSAMQSITLLRRFSKHSRSASA
jgi:hypothetical protein